MTTKAAKKLVKSTFEDGGCFRTVNVERQLAETSQSYKKGYEVRFKCWSKREVADLKRALKSLSIEPGKPYEKGNGYILPVYGRDQVDELYDVILA